MSSVQMNLVTSGVNILPVELPKSYRLINHGPTVLVSATYNGVTDVMAAAWCCALDFDPPKLMVVLDQSTKTRELVEASGKLVVQVPTVDQLAMTSIVGTKTLRTDPKKLEEAGVRFIEIDDVNEPFVEGCAAWLACKIISEPHNQSTYDLFILEIVGAWAVNEAFRDGHWHFETTDPRWRSLHYIAGGQFYATGEAMNAEDQSLG